VRTLVLTLLLATVTACKSDPTWDAGFIEDPRILDEGDALPFHRWWVSESYDVSRYEAVLIKPLVTRTIRDVKGWDAATLEFERTTAVKRVARAARRSLNAAFAGDGDQLLRPSPRLGARTLVVEMALIELRPTKSWFNVIGYLVTRLSFDKGRVAMETKITDGETGELLMAFADREAGKATFFSVDDLTWYGHAEAILEDWSAQILEVVKRGHGAEVSDSATYTFWPF